MGGCGSGRVRHKVAVEDCYTLSLSALLRNGHIQDEQSTETVLLNKPGYARSYVLTIDVIPAENLMSMYLRECKQWAHLHSTSLNIGGLRWWFECSGCGRRCTRLYAGSAGGKFTWRICMDQTYRSSQEAHTSAGAIKRALKGHIRKSWRRKRDRRPHRASRAGRNLSSPMEHNGCSAEPKEWLRQTAIQVMDKLDPYAVLGKSPEEGFQHYSTH